jgi:hypothetical protein
MRIGTTAVETGGAQALGKLADQLRRAADDGLASVWMANVFGLEALTSLAVAGSQVPGIELGTAVVPTYPRHPAVLAQQALTTALAVGPGRLTLGIGLSHKVVGTDPRRAQGDHRRGLAIAGRGDCAPAVCGAGEIREVNGTGTCLAPLARGRLLVDALGDRLAAAVLVMTEAAVRAGFNIG